MRKTTVAAQTVIVNTCTAGSVVQLCHLGLPRHFLPLSFARVWRTRSRTPEGTGEYITGQEASGYSSETMQSRKKAKGSFWID